MQKFLFGLMVSSVVLGADEVKDLFSLSLEELLNVEIYTASQSTEKSASSTSTVTVITGEQLRNWGVHTVYEALRYVPGISINETYMGYTVATFRGVSPGLYNTKALFMVDGHPVHEKLFGSSHAEFVPIEAIERIEIVRTPASVLYGTNAISGVVNIITSDKSKDDSMVTLRGGSYNHSYQSLHYHDKKINISGAYLHDSGYSYDGINDELGNKVNFPYHDKLANMYARYSDNGWEVSGGFFRENEAKFGINPFVVNHGNNIQTGYLLDVVKNIPMGNDELKIIARYDRMDKEIRTLSFPGPTLDGSETGRNEVVRYSGGLQYHGRMDNENTYILGVNYEYDQSSPFLFSYDDNGTVNSLSPFSINHHINTIASFGQYTGYIDKLKYVLGMRIENNSIIGYSGILLNIGVSYEVKENEFLRLSYSEAYRAPNFLELYTTVPSLRGNQNLNREKIKTYELGYEGKIFDKNVLQVSLFYLTLVDEIARRVIPSGREYYNSEGRGMHGVEMQLQSIINSDLEGTFNLSWMDGRQKTQADNYNLANWTANIMLSQYLSKSLRLNGTYHYEGTKPYLLTNNVIGKISDYHLVNLGINYTMGKHEMGIDIKNIFDTTYFVPESVRQNIPQLPGGPGRTAYLTYRYYF